MFRLSTEFQPRGDQPQAIAKLVEGLNRGDEFQTLLGATGTGKTFTMASVIAAVQRPALVIAHNKTLAAQLCQEFRAFFPENAIHFFISYYDYYQPEAYVPQSDTYIEKTASVNDEIDRLRHAATQAVLERRDVIVVASVSSIYGLGSPQEYLRSIVTVKRGDRLDPRELAMRLVELQYTRSDMVLGRGTFRIRGDVIDVQPADEEYVTRIELFGDEVERIYEYDPLKGETIAELDRVSFFPATHYVTPWDRMDAIIEQIREELETQVAYFESQGRLLEAQRIRQRTEMDLEMMRELGYCNGIENYSRYFDGRQPGESPYTLLDYFPEDYILFIDESHQTIPQIRAMYNGDLQRKRTLVEYGFRLPSALDNRPLRFEEFLQRVGQVIFVSATPGPFEREVSQQIVEQIIRPTGLLDPEVIVRPTAGQSCPSPPPSLCSRSSFRRICRKISSMAWRSRITITQPVPARRRGHAGTAGSIGKKSPQTGSLSSFWGRPTARTTRTRRSTNTGGPWRGKSCIAARDISWRPMPIRSSRPIFLSNSSRPRAT